MKKIVKTFMLLILLASVSLSCTNDESNNEDLKLDQSVEFAKISKIITKDYFNHTKNELGRIGFTDPTKLSQKEIEKNNHEIVLLYVDIANNYIKSGRSQNDFPRYFADNLTKSIVINISPEQAVMGDDCWDNYLGGLADCAGNYALALVSCFPPPRMGPIQAATLQITCSIGAYIGFASCSWNSYSQFSDCLEP